MEVKKVEPVVAVAPKTQYTFTSAPIEPSSEDESEPETPVQAKEVEIAKAVTPESVHEVPVSSPSPVLEAEEEGSGEVENEEEESEEEYDEEDDIDLSNYFTKEEVTKMIEEALIKQKDLLIVS